jgi:hypothetical protein
MKALGLFLVVGLALVALLVGVARLDGYVAGAISLVAATLVSNWYERRRRAGG